MTKPPIGRLAVFLVFAVSRFVLVSSNPPASTLADVNVRYAIEAQRAANQGISFYKLHEESRRIEAPTSLPVERVVEYPPLAILWMKVPTWFLDPIPRNGLAPDSYWKAAKRANLIAMFVVDLCGFGLLTVAGATAAQLAVYTAGGLLLFPLLFDRFDLLLGVLLLGAMLLLMHKRSHWAALTVLAVAINFKLVPLVLVPLFVLGTLPADALSASSGAKPWRPIAGRLMFLFVIGVALFLPFFMQDGFATLGFLRYHAMRGLEIGAVWNTLPIALGVLFGWPVRGWHRFGGVELTSALSGPFRTMASVFTAAVIPAVAVVLWKLLAKRGTPAGRCGDLTLAQANPALFLRCAVACLLTAIVGAHVLSPQYLLWLVPLVALWDGRAQRSVSVVFLVICGLTTASYPYATGRLLGALSVEDGFPLWSRLFWAGPQIARNLLLTGFTAWLWIGLFRSPAGTAAGREGVGCDGGFVVYNNENAGVQNAKPG